MADTSNERGTRPPPHPSARVIAEALAGLSYVAIGSIVGEVVKQAFGLWTYTPVLFIASSVIVLPRVMRRLGYRMLPKPEEASSDQLRSSKP